MTAAPYLPEDVAEVASIHVSVGLGVEEGTGCSYHYDGLSPEAAIGYLTTVIDQLREDVRRRWDQANGEGEAWRLVSLECPHCGHDIELDDEEDADEDDDE